VTSLAVARITAPSATAISSAIAPATRVSSRRSQGIDRSVENRTDDVSVADGIGHYNPIADIR
jgi:hypothetical protein